MIARPDCASYFLAGMRKYIFAQGSLYVQGINNDINKQDTSFLDCKHKHMMNCGAPPDKFGVHVPYVSLKNSMFSQAELILRFSLFGSWSYFNFFRESMGPFEVLLKYNESLSFSTKDKHKYL